MIQNLTYEGSMYLASFDVTSLFTNIPTEETIQITLDSLCDETDSFINLSRKELQKLLTLATSDNVFYFNSILYRQTNGMAMGSSLSGCFANIFMGHHETTWLAKCPINIKPKLCFRYVDDYFFGFENKEQVKSFLTYMNSQHDNIKFTSEEETNGILNFLDLKIKHQNGRFTTSTYRKPTYTGLGTNFSSFIPHKYKTNSLQTLIQRAYVTCSDWLSFDHEVKFLTDFFEENNFPTKLIQAKFRQFIDNLFEPKPLICTVQKEKLYVKLPFLGPFSYHIRNLLTKSINPSYPQLDIRYVFTNNNTISTLFPFKDKIPDKLQSFVCYHYKCIICKNDYVGITTCNLGKRIAEHAGVSERTGKEKATITNSAIFQHRQRTRHPIQETSFKIIGRARTEQELLTLEALKIRSISPKLNIQESSFVLYT